MHTTQDEAHGLPEPTLDALWGAGSDPRGGRPVVVALHGFGSCAQDLVRLAGFLGDWDVVSLEGLESQPPGRRWFPITTPGVPDPAAVQAAADAVVAFVESSIDPERTVAVLGFSQGGTTAFQVARTRPHRFAAAVVLSGFVAPGEHSGDHDLADRGFPVFWGRDEADPVIAPVAIERTSAHLPRWTVPTTRLYPGIGHGISRTELADVQTFLAAVLPGT